MCNLIIAQYYASEPPLRPSTLAPSPVERGPDGAVVTGFPCYPGGKVYPGYRAERRTREKLASRLEDPFGDVAVRVAR